jgi:fructose-1,6-bisphosphatase/inositol monophosphatase family enzyme
VQKRPGSIDIDRVTELLEEAIAELVLPRLGRLEPHDIQVKGSVGEVEDLVTSVDRAVEAWLSPRLASLIEGSVVIGEEAVHADPRSLEALHQAHWLWLVDPIDGTRNFVEGRDNFGVMVALLERSRTRAAWIALPGRGQMFVAEEGGGAFRDGARLRLPRAGQTGPLRGNLSAKYMEPDTRRKVEAWPEGRYMPVKPNGSAAIDYTALAQHERDFSVYHRLLPWDHAPGTLLLTEAGGSVRHLDGQTYHPAHSNRLMVCASTLQCGEALRGWLLV